MQRIREIKNEMRSGIMMKVILRVITFLLAGSMIRSYSQPHKNEKNVPAIQVMIFGTPHLRRHNFQKIPIAVEKIAASLSRFEPDLVVVEWLHPSLNPDDVPWYKKSYGDMVTLARLWGYKEEHVDSVLHRGVITLQNLKAFHISTEPLRVELGKLYYLKSDLVNAAYQWWLAEQEGGTLEDLKRLTRDNYANNEINRYGFVIAGNQGHEYVASFDYHDWDAAWLGGRIWSEVRKIAILTVDGVQAEDENWNTVKDGFDRAYRAWSDGEDDEWIKKYGHIKEVREYVDYFVLEWRKAHQKETRIDNRDGIGLMWYYQSNAFIEQQRRLYYDGMTRVSIQGLGKKNVENFELRNKHMVDLMEGDIQRLKSKKVLVVVGSGHKLFLENELKARGYVITPSYDFMPENRE